MIEGLDRNGQGGHGYERYEAVEEQAAGVVVVNGHIFPSLYRGEDELKHVAQVVKEKHRAVLLISLTYGLQRYEILSKFANSINSTSKLITPQIQIMIKRIISISGRPGLFRLVNQGKNMLIVESLANGKRTPAYAHDKVVSLGDISIYTLDGDVPLADVFEKIKEKTGGASVDVKAMDNDALRAYFAEILPDFDDERVYTNDIRKVFQWYNQLIAAGVTEFKDNEIAQDEAAEAAEKADEESAE